MAVLPQLLPYYGDSPSLLEIFERQRGFFVALSDLIIVLVYISQAIACYI